MATRPPKAPAVSLFRCGRAPVDQNGQAFGVRSNTQLEILGAYLSLDCSEWWPGFTSSVFEWRNVCRSGSEHRGIRYREGMGKTGGRGAERQIFATCPLFS